MKLDALAAAAAAVVAAAAVAGAFRLVSLYMPGSDPRFVFMIILDALPFVQLSMAISLLIIVVAVVLALAQRRGAARRSGGGRLVFRLLAVVATALALGAAAWSWLASEAASAQMGGVSLEVRAPGFVEMLLCIAYGMLAAAIALTAGRLAHPQPRG